MRETSLMKIRVTSCALWLLVASLCLFVSNNSPHVVPFPEAEDEQEQRAETLAASIANFTVSPSSVYVGEEMTFNANASSTTGPSLKFTLFYDYILTLPSTPNPASPRTVNTTGNPGAIIQKFTYDHVGNFTGAQGTFFVARLYVDDGATNVSRQIAVYVRENVGPTFEFNPPDYLDIDMSEQLNLSVKLKDVDNDTLVVAWDFGDGESVTENTTGALAGVYSNQTHAWTPAVEPGEGDYYVDYLLNITADDGCGHVISHQTAVHVYVPWNIGPTVSLNASDYLASTGDEVLFRANATDSEGDPLTWTFDFDDGTVEVYYTDACPPETTLWVNLSHSFVSVGNYSVTLNVSDALPPNQTFPHNVSASVLVRVRTNTPPAVSGSITSIPTTPMIDVALGYVLVSFFIDTVDIDGDPLYATWSVDGTTAGTNTSAGGLTIYRFWLDWSFSDAGEHNVSVVVTDGRESHDVLRYLVIFVESNNMPPDLRELSFEYDSGDFAVPGEDIQFRCVFSDDELDPIEIILDFGDSSEQIQASLTDYINGNVTLLFNHSYSDVGIYTLTMWYTDNMIGLFNHSIFIEAEVTVEILLLADAGPDQDVLAGEQVFFDATGSVACRLIENWSWTFTWHGSPVTLYGEVASYVFDEPFQTVAVTLNVTDSAGNWDTDDLVVNVGGWIPELPSLILPMAAMAVCILGVLFRRISTNRHRTDRS